MEAQDYKTRKNCYTWDTYLKHQKTNCYFRYKMFSFLNGLANVK